MASSSEVHYTISPSSDSTLAVEVFKTGLMRKKKHLVFFERFEGRLRYEPERPEGSQVEITIDTRSAVCRDTWLKSRKQQAVTHYVQEQALEAQRYPEMTFVSQRISAKELRGYVVEGELKIRGVSRMMKVNVVLSPRKYDRFQVDGDTGIRLSDFGIEEPKAMLGLVGTKDEALIRLLLWATPGDQHAA